MTTRDASAALPRETRDAFDLVKAWCVLWMILLHSFHWVVTDQGSLLWAETTRFFAGVKPLMILGFFPLMLPVTAGFSLRFTAQFDPVSGRLTRESFRRMLFAAVTVSIAALVTNYLAAGLHALFFWSVLPLVATSMAIVAVMLILLPRWFAYGVGLGVIGATPLIHAFVVQNPTSYWGRAVFGNELGPGGWPLFPWFGSVVFGMLIAELALRTAEPRSLARRLVAIGCLLLPLPLFQGRFIPELDPTHLMGPRLFNPPPAFVAAVLAVTCFTLAVGLALSPRLSLEPHGIVRSYSRGILFIYAAHLVIGDRLAQALQQRLPPGPLVIVGGRVGGPAIAISFTLLLLVLSYWVGRAALVLLSERVVHVRLRKVGSPKPV